MSKAWPTIRLILVPGFILQDLKISTYCFVLLLSGHVVGPWQNVCSMSTVALSVFDAGAPIVEDLKM